MLNKNFLKITGGFKTEDNTHIDFMLAIHVPQKHSSESDYYCRVVSHQLDIKLDVYGVTPDQAAKFAIQTGAALLSTTLCTGFAAEG